MKKAKRKHKIQMGTPITISTTPYEIKVDGLKINQSECINNSYKVAKNNPNVEIIEGVILLIDNQNRGTAIKHMWNKTNEIHFDVTDELVWTGREETKKIKELKYFFIKLHTVKKFKNGDVFEFCSDTYEYLNMMNNKIREQTNEATE